MLDLGQLNMPQFWEMLKDQGDYFCGTCREKIDSPFFQENTVLCRKCGSPTFSLRDV